MDENSKEEPTPKWGLKSKSNRTLNVGAISSSPNPPASSDDEPFDSSKFRIRKQPKPPNYPIRSQVRQRNGNERFKVSVVSMQGHREDMEDAHSVVLKLKGHPECGFFGVFDGHSGCKASEWCAAHVHEFVDQVKDFNEENLKEALVKADLKFLEETKSNPPIQDGTTAVYAIVDRKKNQIHVSNLGDSRCLVGSYSSPKFTPMTVDHKPYDEEEIARVTAAGGQVVRKRVDGLLAVSRSIGDATYKDNPNLPHEKQKVSPVPVITTMAVTDDNYLFICCDGIFETFSNEEAMTFIHERIKDGNTDSCEILSDLLNAVLNKGSKDNMTAILVEFKSGSNYHKSKNEFIVGEFYERGNPTFLKGYQDYCEKNGYNFEKAKTEWQKKKAQMEEEKQLSLEELVSKLCTIDCIAASALRDAFMSAENAGRKIND